MPVNRANPHRSTFGMDANIAALLVYLAAGILSFIPIIRYVAFAAPVVVFFVEKESKFVKFHAMQASVFSVAWWALSVIFDIVGSIIAVSLLYNPLGSLGVLGILGIISLLISIAFGVAEIICLIKAYNYEVFKFPVVGNIAEKLCVRFDKTA